MKSVSECDGDGRQGGSFTCAVRRLPAGVTLVRTTGHLNGQTGSQMCQVIADELVRKPTQLVLELSGTTSVDGAAVEAVLSASALAAESNISFCLVAPEASPLVRVLAAEDLIERFEIFATVREATRNR
ncbi:STAS domain-containing protein [Mycobacterium sp. M23085]|uniref:STAS domain-containing protein n=1 Tax=Mycobacterium sp. M23085 TaxID=3378087 RepID=UPI003877BDDB